MLEIIKRPVFTEKTIQQLEKYNHYAFDVDQKLTKPQIRLLIENLFSVKVIAINTNRLPRKKRRRGGSIGVVTNFKRTFVSVVKGEKIVLFQDSLFLWVCVLFVR